MTQSCRPDGTGSVAFVGTASKTLAPALRLAWVVPPSHHFDDVEDVLPERADEHETAKRARRSGLGLHELHRHCTTHAPSPQALLLGFALPSESDLIAATVLLAQAIC